MRHIEYYMPKSVSHPVSSIAESPISPRRAHNICPGLIQHVIQILTCHVHYIIYFNQTSSIVCEGVRYKVCGIGLWV